MKKIVLPMLFAALIAASCGNKNEVNIKTQDTSKTLTQVPPKIDTPQTQSKDTGTLAGETKNLKKETTIKKDETNPKKDTVVKKEETGNTNEINFASIFKKRCVKCHGSNGKGKIEGVPDLTASKTQRKSDEQLFKIITNGVKGETEDDEDMPSFKNKLSEDERHAAVKFVKSLR